jgi:hypothetical protein
MTSVPNRRQLLNGNKSLEREGVSKFSDEFETQFHGWLKRVTESEKPPAGLVAFNIGLFETESGYAAYLIGSDYYSDEGDDWACNETYTPLERYFYFPETTTGKIKWEQAQALTIDAIKTFLARNPDSFLAKTGAVTLGFDDGDLVRVK